MKVIIAPDSFKESIDALGVANAIEKGFRKVFPDVDIVKIPMADGGEGTVQSIISVTNGKIMRKNVTGPLGETVEAYFGILGDRQTAIIEMAAASGLHLVPKEKRNPLWMTTKGTGELILAAVEAGATKIIIGLGGSATNDGGMGMAKALGIKFLDDDGKDIGDGGGNLSKLAKIDVSNMDPRLQNLKILVACDVESPLIGENGASRIFGPQKGASPSMIQQLDENLAHYAEIIKRDIGKDVAHLPGSGAAGGLGAGLIAFLNAELKSGVELVLEATNFKEQLKDAELVITGEGKIDSQTIYGKTPIGVAKLAKESGVPVIAIAGNLSHDFEVVHDYGIDALFSIVPGVTTIEEALSKAAMNIENTATNIARLYKLGLIARSN